MPLAHDAHALPHTREALPPATPRPPLRRLAPAARQDRDDSRRRAALAVQRSLDRRDNGGSFGH